MFKTSNVEKIHEITYIPNPIRKRIQRECQSMQYDYDEIVVGYTDTTFISFQRKNNTYFFKISANYPFQKPELYINGLDLKYLYDLRTSRFKNLLKYVSGMNCLCCHSLLCKDNWSPSTLFERIISQMEYFKTIKYHIFLKIIADQIKVKYLISDIDLDSWLFTPALL
jgi:hypothetical protein